MVTYLPFFGYQSDITLMADTQGRAEGCRVSVKVVSDAVLAFGFSVVAPPALTSPTPPLPEGEEGIKKKLSWSFSPLSLGERGAGGGEGRRRDESSVFSVY
jgi:hypothetical protein